MRRLVLGVLISVLTSLGLTVGTTSPAHAARAATIVYTSGPDAYGTYNDIRYGTSSSHRRGSTGR